jgi:hypothetical protein
MPRIRPKARGLLAKKQRALAAEEERLRRKMNELERVIRRKSSAPKDTSGPKGIVLETKRDMPWSLHATVNPALRPGRRKDSSLRVERKKVFIQFISLLAILLALVLLLLSQLM